MAFDVGSEFRDAEYPVCSRSDAGLEIACPQTPRVFSETLEKTRGICGQANLEQECYKA